MSWSDDIRCLHCDGRLPLYRKITHGQFCSSAHRKAYWQEQEQLALERLSQTHNSLQAHRPPLTVTPIGAAGAQPPAPEDWRDSLAPSAPAATREALDALEALASAIAGPVPPTALSSLEWLPGRRAADALDLMAAEPVEYPPLPPLATTRGLVAFARGSEGLPLAGSVRPGSMMDSIRESMTRRAAARVLEQPTAPYASLLPFVNPAGTEPVELRGEIARSGDPRWAYPLSALTAAPRRALAVDLRWVGRREPERVIAFWTAENGAEPLACETRGPVLDVAFEIRPATAGLDQGPTRMEAPAPVQAAIGLARPLPRSFVPSETGLAKSAAAAAGSEALVWSSQKPLSLHPAAGESAPPLAGRHALPLRGSVSVNLGAQEIGLGQGTPLAARRVAEFSSLKPNSGAAERGAQVVLAPGHVYQVAPATAVETAAGGEILPETPHSVIALPRAAGKPVPATQVTLAGKLPLAPGRIANFARPSASLSATDSNAGWATALTALYLLPQPSRIEVMLPHLRLEPLDAKPIGDAFQTALPVTLPPKEAPVTVSEPAQAYAAPSSASSQASSSAASSAPTAAPPAVKEDPPRGVPAWAPLTHFWKHAPRDLRILMIALPALITLAFHPFLPKVSVQAPKTSGLETALGAQFNAQFNNVRRSVIDRAAVALDEDFRSGLDGWTSRANATAEWSFDAAGFVRPGPLALYQPSMGLSDYQVQFLGMIDKKAMSWVVRAADFENYYVIKLVVLKGGPLPILGLTRYAVIDGVAQDRVDTPVAVSAREDMIYRIHVDVHDADFSVEIQGQAIDSWSEPRLRRGGIGFFSARGEESRVRWVQVMHQYDMLGRLCAYLAPYNIPTGSW